MAHRIKKILCAIDLDGSAPSALELAADIAQQLGAEIHLLHVVRMPMPAEGTPAFTEACREQSEEAKVSMQRLMAKHLAQLPSESKVELGDPAGLIVAAAERLPADLLIMSTHARKGLSRFLLGSVAETVMRRAPCPVLTARRQVPPRDIVARWMTQRVVTVTLHDKLTRASAVMQQNRVRSVPVVDDGKVAGIISDRDIRLCFNYLEAIEVESAMTAKVITVTPETAVRDAAKLLSEHKIGALPVVEQEHLVGIISTSDLLEALADAG
jgi:CBS domain-containing protein